MSGRHLAFAVVVVIGSFSCVGCSSRVDRGTTGALRGAPAATKPGSSATQVGGEHASVGVPGQVAVAAPAKPAPPPLKISPESFTITADDYGLQLLVDQNNADGTRRDLTSQVTWSVEPASVARVDQTGYLWPLGEGTVTVRATLESEKAECRVKVAARGERSWDFAEDIVPVLTRLGCNTGSCHDREGDFKSLARDGGERRLTRFAPEQSLFLAKATGRVAHGGGQRLIAGSAEYQVLLAWVRAGAPRERGKTHGAVVRITVEPGAARLAEPGPWQLRVLAHHADGHQRDVTRLAAFKSQDDAGASVTPTGFAKLLRRGETDLVVRYESRVEPIRIAAVVNPDLKYDFSKRARGNFIDDELFKRLESLKVPPSAPATDAAFLRRASLDLTGEQPSPGAIRRYLADTDPEKRIKLIDQLLKSREFLRFWRIKLGDLLQISSTRQGNGAYRYQEWIDASLQKNRHWDDLVRTLLTAVGDPMDAETGGPVNYAMDTLDPKEQSELTAQRFMGLRLRCAQCHDHPFDIWTQDAYYGLAAFFAKVQRGAGYGQGTMMRRAEVSINPEGQVVHLRTQKAAEPQLLDGKVVKLVAKEDPRKALAEWMTAPDNPYFARAAANWAWAQLFGKGLVDPPDDMSRANPAVHPELLDALAKHFGKSKFDMRDLIRTIATSEAYGLSSATVTGNERDARLFSHHLPRPLTAFQMADALAQATDVPYRINNVSRRMIDLPDPLTPNTILDTFGRCARTTGCSSTPTTPLSLRQALLLMGGDVVDSRVTSLNGYLSNALKLELEPEELVENLYFRTVCRPPTAEETSHWGAELKQATSRREAAEDLFWALLNSREFAFNH
jgi:hypothetical protein